ncbi:hypothetical protein H0H93_012716, partial [Arthromyces matolae]
ASSVVEDGTPNMEKEVETAPEVTEELSAPEINNTAESQTTQEVQEALIPIEPAAAEEPEIQSVEHSNLSGEALPTTVESTTNAATESVAYSEVPAASEAAVTPEPVDQQYDGETEKPEPTPIAEQEIQPVAADAAPSSEPVSSVNVEVPEQASIESIDQVPTMQEPSVSEPTAASDDIAPEVPDTVQREKILEPASEIAAEDVSASVSEDQVASTAELVTASAAGTNEVPAPVEEEAAPHAVEKRDETLEVTVPVVVDAVVEETQIATPEVQEQIAASVEEQHTAASIPCPPVVEETKSSAAGVEEFVQISDAVVVEVPVVAEEPVLAANPSEENPVSVVAVEDTPPASDVAINEVPSIVEETRLPVEEESSASDVAEQEQTTTALNEEVPIPACTVHAAEVPAVVEVATVEEDISASDSSASEVPVNTGNAPLAPAIVEEHTPVAEPQVEKIEESILASELTVDKVAAHVEEAHVAT